MYKGFKAKVMCEWMLRARMHTQQVSVCLLLAAGVLMANGCSTLTNTFKLRPRAMSEVPAARLAYRVEADFPANRLPPALAADKGATETNPAIDKDFTVRRTADALVRTIASPDGQRALALYETGDTPEGEFRLDIYSADGNFLFLSNVMPPNISGAFPLMPAWSPDGQSIAFIARESLDAEATRKRGGASEAGDPLATAPVPSATVLPLMAPVAAFQTEQIYVCDRDGRNLRPLTTRDGLIYFNFSWSPDSRFLSALACKEDEWTATANESLAPKGRPRIIALAGGERLLDDRLTSVVPAWSPDLTKVATAFGTDIVIYDTASETPTAATLPLRDTLLAASRQYDAALNANAAKQPQPNSASDANKSADDATPLSFNPVVRLEWVEPDGILAQTAFLRIYRDTPPIKRYERWHVLHLSPQAELVSRVRTVLKQPALAACFAKCL